MSTKRPDVVSPTTEGPLWDVLHEGSRFFMQEGDVYDVQDLIIRLKLPRELGNRLDASVRAEYERLWEGGQCAPPEA